MNNVKHRYEGIKSFNPSILYDYIKSNYLEAYFIPLPKFSYLALLFLNLIQNRISMGAVKSITHGYAANEYLFWHIQRKDLPKISQLLNKSPQLVNQSLTVNYKTTPLHRAATNGNLEIIQLLVETYHADLDFRTSAGQTPLMAAAKRDRSQIVRYLAEKGANTDIISSAGFTALDYAILQGNYECALELYGRGKVMKPKNPYEYFHIAYKYRYRFVDYEIVLQGLQKGTKIQNVKDFLSKPKKKKLNDPVVDPREPWKEWILRNIEFKDPPLVQRGSLPEQLQPQNLKFAKVRHFMTKLTISPLSQKPSFQPKVIEEAQSDYKMNEMESYGSQQIEVKSAF